jgi:Flp pilus assembly protein TadD
MILVFQGQPADAVPLLQEAAALPQADPRYYFHLAVAYDRAGETDKARAALRTARNRDLTRQVLTPLDRQMLADLEKKFN